MVHITGEDELEELLHQGQVSAAPNHVHYTSEPITPLSVPNTWLQIDGKLVCVNWYTPSCRKCMALKTRWRRIAKANQDLAIFADGDANAIEYTDGRPSGPLRLMNRLGVDKFPTYSTHSPQCTSNPPQSKL